MTANLDDSDELTVSNGRTANVIMARLRRAIESGVYADGEQLPAERQLAITFGTARSTIRKVLDQLDLSVAPGRSLVIIGGSGQGKSVTIKAAHTIINTLPTSASTSGEMWRDPANANVVKVVP